MRSGFSKCYRAVNIGIYHFLVLFLSTLVITVFSWREAQSSQVTLSWYPPSTYTDGTELNNLAGFNLYLGTTSCNYMFVVNVGKMTTYTFSDLTDGVRYYFAVTAYDGFGTESAYSNEASVVAGSLTMDSICAAKLSSCLGLYVPIVDFNGMFFWGYLTCELLPDENIICLIRDYGLVNPQDYAACQPSTLSSQLDLHIPIAMYDNTSYQADLSYVPAVTGQIWFKVISATPN